MLFTCKACPEKDKRINDLIDQIKMLRKMVYPALDKGRASLQADEVDRMLGGSDELIHVHEYDQEYEAASLLTGSYDHSQVERE